MFKVQPALPFPTLMPVLTFLADASWLDKLSPLGSAVHIFRAQISLTVALMRWQHLHLLTD